MMLDRIRRAYDALQKAPTPTPLYRLHPELEGRQHLFSSAAAALATGAADGYVSGAEVYRVYAWVRKAIAMKVAAVAPLPVRVVDADGKASASPIDQLLVQPNDRMDGTALWATAFTHKDLGGEYFLEVVDDARGRPAELWPRRPDQVEIAPDESRPAYPAPAGYQVAGIAPLLPPEAVIHERYLNPLSDWRGLAPGGAVANDVALDLFALTYAKSFFKNQARPDYAIETEEALTPDERERVEIQIDQTYGPGGLRTHKPMVLEAGQKISVLSWPMKDLALLELREPNRQAVGAIYGVPDEIMGFGKDTYENFDTALRVFWLLTLLPMVQARDATLTGFFSRTRPLLRPGQRVATDLTGVSVLQEALGPKLEQALRLWQMGVPFNTIDQQLKLGIGTIPGGDVGFVSAGILPITEAVIPMPAPAPAPTPAPEPEQQRAAQVATKASAQRIGRALQRVRRGVAGQMERDVARYFEDLAARVVARAREAEKAVTNGHGGTATKGWPTLGDLLRRTDEDALRELFRTYAVGICEASWETWNTALGADLAFERTDPAVVAATAQSGARVTAIADTTREGLRAVLEYGAEQGWTIDQLVSGVGDQVGLRDIVSETYRGRARTIARSELGEAQATATVARYRSAGVTRVTIYDGGTDDSDDICTQLNGTVQTLAWYAANKLQHPNCVRAAAPSLEHDD